jgi:predicted Rossmann fold flavoprotein
MRRQSPVPGLPLPVRADISLPGDILTSETLVVNPTNVLIVGGGASGLMAAVTAARRGARVTIAERQDRVGRKILATGNGRCNLTNVNCSPSNFHGQQPGFAASALESFPSRETTAFFEQLGASCRIEDQGKVFPVTGQASTVLDVLRTEVARLGVDVLPISGVTAITEHGDRLSVRAGDQDLAVDRVIVCTGGRAVPQLGGNDSGMQLLVRLGHKLVPAFPVLVPLKTDTHFGRHVKGTKVHAGLRLEAGGQVHVEAADEVLFTDYGLSGPPIIQVSLAAAYALHDSVPVRVTLDLLPDWPADRLPAELARRVAAWPSEPIESVLIGLVHKRLITVLLAACGVTDPRMAAATVSAASLDSIAKTIRGWIFEVTGTLAWSEAHVMAGGVSTEAFDPATLQSRLVPGVYAAGEVLDVVGDCGGYNLQWAWSSGRLAALKATGG